MTFFKVLVSVLAFVIAGGASHSALASKAKKSTETYSATEADPNANRVPNADPASDESSDSAAASADESSDDAPAAAPVQLPSLHYKRPVPTAAVSARPAPVAKVAAPAIAAPAAPVVLAQPAPITRTVIAQEPAQNRVTGAFYDPVPSDQVNSIAKRLKVVEFILRKYGRAYDYRTHTYRELVDVLAALEAGSTSRSAPAPAINTEPAPPAPPTAPAEEESSKS